MICIVTAEASTLRLTMIECHSSPIVGRRMADSAVICCLEMCPGFSERRCMCAVMAAEAGRRRNNRVIMLEGSTCPAGKAGVALLAIIRAGRMPRERRLPERWCMRGGTVMTAKAI